MKKKSVCILNYGSGNTGSVYNLLKKLNVDAKISNEEFFIKSSTHIILPGVGAFGDSMEKIKNKIPLQVLEDEVFNRKKPFLGICVGMQVLANQGFEFGKHDGLGWVEGKVNKLKAKMLPHIGWNNISIKKNSEIFSNLGDYTDFYFVNSYAFIPENEEHIIAETDYEGVFCSAIQKNNIFGVQFHPEKSQNAGQIVVKNFLKYVNKE